MNAQYNVIAEEERNSIIKALSEFKELKIWKNDLEKKRKWNTFLKIISEITEIKKPRLLVSNAISEIGYGTYDPTLNTIIMRTHSILTLLYEFYLVNQYKKNIKQTRQTNKDALEFSSDVFFAVFPKKKTKLKFDNGVYTKRTDGV